VAKLNLTKLYKAFYTSSTEPSIVEVPEVNFLTIVGRGAPVEGFIKQMEEENV